MKCKNIPNFDSINSRKTSSKLLKRSHTLLSCPSSLPAGWGACLRNYSLKAARDARNYLQTSASFIHTSASTQMKNPISVLNRAAACPFARRATWSSIEKGFMRAAVLVVVAELWMTLAVDVLERGRDRGLSRTIKLKTTAVERKKFLLKDRIRRYDQMFEKASSR